MSRDERIEALYDRSARELAEHVVDLEDAIAELTEARSEESCGYKFCVLCLSGEHLRTVHS